MTGKQQSEVVVLNSLDIEGSNNMTKTPVYDNPQKHDSPEHDSPDVKAFNEPEESLLKLKTVQMQESDTKKKKNEERQRIGSATSRYLSQKGPVNDIILETEESIQSSPEAEHKKQIIKDRRKSKGLEQVNFKIQENELRKKNLPLSEEPSSPMFSPKQADAELKKINN